MKRIQKILGNDEIYTGLVDCYKKLLVEGNKEKIEYFKALVKGCVKKWSSKGDKGGYIPMREFLTNGGYQGKNFYEYTEDSYERYSSKKNKDRHTIYGYPTHELMKEIL
jgi:hypothetical protein